MKNINKILVLTISFFPAVVFAASFKDFLDNIIGQLEVIPAFLMGLSMVFLLYNIFQYIQVGGEAKKREEQRAAITYSIILLFVMVSVWGLVAILVETAGLDNAPIVIPQI